MSSRDYWMNVSVELADNVSVREAGGVVEEHGLASGSRISLIDSYGRPLSDEAVDRLAASGARSLAVYLKRLRDIEVERLRRENDRFWSKLFRGDFFGEG